MPRFKVWLPRALFESVLIVFSILLALAMNEWQQDRERVHVVHRSILLLEREIRRNESSLTDQVPYHAGLRVVLHKGVGGDGVATVAAYREVMQEFEPASFINSAWSTAMATGSLANMDFELVSAISLTYGIQSRLEQIYATGPADLMQSGKLTQENLPTTISAASRYIDDVTAREDELEGVYKQALQIIATYKKAAGLGDSAP